MTKSKIILTIQQYDTLSNSVVAGGGKRAVLPSEYRETALQYVRLYLVKEGHLPRKYVNKAFCDKSGADVSDDTTFGTYMTMNEESAEKEDADAKASLYYKAVKQDTGIDDHTKKFLDETNLNLELTSPKPLADAVINKPSSSFSPKDWRATAGGPAAYAADMDEYQWGVVMRNNDLLHGKFFEGGDTHDKLAVPTGIKRARYAAFALKERAIPKYNIGFKVASPPPAGLDTSEVKFRIPRFQICDSSKVEVFETKSSIEDSMARNAFSQTTVEASAGGGALGVSVGVKAGATTSNSSRFSQSASNDESHMHIRYMFPRVEVFFDAEDLELSPECEEELKKVASANAKKEDADNFFRKFGHVFVPQVQLGGRLYSVEKETTIAGATAEEKMSALKAAASASVSGWGFQASVSASHETTQAATVNKSQSSMTHSITWNADGGDTLLCNNPPAWCSTVQSYYNWRVMNQIGMIDIVQLIGKLDSWSHIPKKFEDIYYKGVEFKLSEWDAKEKDKGYVGIVSNEQLIESPEGAGGNFSRRAKRYLLTKSKNGEGHANATLQINSPRENIAWEGVNSRFARFKYGTYYPLRFHQTDPSTGKSILSGVRRTTQEERYQKKNVLYAGKEEEPNILVMFRKADDPGDEASKKAEVIRSTHMVRVDFYDLAGKEWLGFLRNSKGVSEISQTDHAVPPDGAPFKYRQFKFFYV